MLEVLIVDGYNIIHAVPEIEKELDISLMSARKALEAALRRYQLGEKSIREIYIVYDGKGASSAEFENLGLIKNVYTAAGSSADSEIVNILKGIKRLDRAAVFSKDNFVINHARALGAAVLPIANFRRKISWKKINAGASGPSEKEKEEINKELRTRWGI